MASTNFIEFTTPIEATWLNDVNDHVYNENSVAHDAVNITAVPSGVITTSNVQAALEELSSGILSLDTSYVLLNGGNVMTGDLQVTRDASAGAAIWVADETTTGDMTTIVAFADNLNPSGSGIGAFVSGDRSGGVWSAAFGAMGATDTWSGWAGVAGHATAGDRRIDMAGNVRVTRANSTQDFLETGFRGAGQPLPTSYRHRLKAGGNIEADGGLVTPAADYAEMFEWADGNTSEEDRRGYPVVLDNGKIRIATGGDATDDIIGVVSGNPTVLGDEPWNHWHDRFLRDDFGSPIMEDYDELLIEVDGTNAATGEPERQRFEIEEDRALDAFPNHNMVIVERTTRQREKLNPAYDPEMEYTPRMERTEWDAVGMMGKLRLRVGQPTGTRWIKIRDISADVEEWLVR